MGDDVELYTDDGAATNVLARFHFLRQQADKDGEPCTLPGGLHRAAGDRASPITSAASRSPPASGSKELCDGFRAKHDDYNAIMAEALADRLAEAFAEYLHKRCATSGATAATRT